MEKITLGKTCSNIFSAGSEIPLRVFFFFLPCRWKRFKLFLVPSVHVAVPILEDEVEGCRAT